MTGIWILFGFSCGIVFVTVLANLKMFRVNNETKALWKQAHEDAIERNRWLGIIANELSDIVQLTMKDGDK
jgi:hypothetical protein